MVDKMAATSQQWCCSLIVKQTGRLSAHHLGILILDWFTGFSWGVLHVEEPCEINSEKKKTRKIDCKATFLKLSLMQACNFKMESTLSLSRISLLAKLAHTDRNGNSN